MTYAIIAIFVLIMILGFVHFQNAQKQLLASTSNQMREMEFNNRQLQENLNQNFNQNLQFQKILGEKFDSINKQVSQGMEKTTEKTSATINKIHERLATLDKAQENILKLSTQVDQFKDILSNKQSRGAFGEVQLNDLVSNILPPSAYELQATLSNTKRADCLIKMPNPPGSIVVDSKFPLENYQTYASAKTEVEKLSYARAFRTDVEKHIKDISEKYIIAGETADSALMFIPSEAIYAEIYANFPQLVEKSFKAHVWIVSPTTLMATLNTVRAVLKDAKMKEQTAIIQKEVGMLVGDLDRLDKRVQNLDSHFNLATKDLDMIKTSSNKISSRAEKIESIEVEENIENDKQKSINKS